MGALAFAPAFKRMLETLNLTGQKTGAPDFEVRRARFVISSLIHVHIL